MTVDQPTRRRAVVRGVGAARALTGGLVIARPKEVARWLAGTGGPGVPGALVRTLGARLALQAVAEVARPTPRVVFASATVDATHALSMLVPFALDRRYRRAAVINAAASTVAVALLAREARPGAEKW